MHTHITEHTNLQNCILKDVVSTPIWYILVHATYINKRFSKLLVELVFTGHTVPVVQVQHYFGENIPTSTVVAQYLQW